MIFSTYALGSLIFASALIFTSSVLVAQTLKNSLRMRGVELEAWCKMLRQLQVEISYGLTPLPQAFAKCNVGFLQDFCQNISRDLEGQHDLPKVWLENLAAANKKWHLLDTDFEILAALAGDLGCSAVSDQNRILNLAIEKLSGEQSSAEAEFGRLGRLIGGLGYSAGLLLVAICW